MSLVTELVKKAEGPDLVTPDAFDLRTPAQRAADVATASAPPPPQPAPPKPTTAERLAILQRSKTAAARKRFLLLLKKVELENTGTDEELSALMDARREAGVSDVEYAAALETIANFKEAQIAAKLAAEARKVYTAAQKDVSDLQEEYDRVTAKMARLRQAAEDKRWGTIATLPGRLLGSGAAMAKLFGPDLL